MLLRSIRVYNILFIIYTFFYLDEPLKIFLLITVLQYYGSTSLLSIIRIDRYSRYYYNNYSMLYNESWFNFYSAIRCMFSFGIHIFIFFIHISHVLIYHKFIDSSIFYIHFFSGSKFMILLITINISKFLYKITYHVEFRHYFNTCLLCSVLYAIGWSLLCI